MNIKRFIPVCLFVAILMSACTERIDISTEDAPAHLSIYGYITTDTMQHTIRICRSTGYFDNNKPEGISNALVTISTDDQTFVLTEKSSDPGLYQTDANVYGIEGKTYTMNVSLDFDNDGQMEQYRASSLLPLSMRLDSIALAWSTTMDNYIDVLAYAELKELTENNTLSFHIYNNGVSVNDSLIGYSIVNEEYINTTTIKGVSCALLNQGKDADPREIIKSGDVITLRVDVLTKDYGTFIQNAQAEVMGSIPLFSGPPANVVSNIKSQHTSNKIPIVGYFTAYSGQQMSTIAK